MDHEYVDHADCGTFTTGVIIKTYDEKAYREARKQIFDLIGELENSDISPDQKQQIITGLKAVLKSNLATALVIEYFKKIIGLP